MATSYEEQFRTALQNRPLDRSLLSGFVEMVRGVRHNPMVLEVGSGPGMVSAFVRDLGVKAVGIDLSPRMVELAKNLNEDIDFHVGDMRSLEVTDKAFAGLIAWYSIIHLEPADVPVALSEFHRALDTDGYLLLAFQLGDSTLHLDEAFGYEVDIDFRRLQPQAIATMLNEVGFKVVAEIVQAPDATSIAAQIPQAIIIAQRQE